MSRNLPELSAPRHLPFLEGVRGLAALYVVCHHAWFEVVYKETQNLSPLIFYTTRWLRFGQHGVDLFIVLSGFCLMLPLIQQGNLAGGVAGFFKRRARRILPPYYAALGIALLLILVAPMMRAGSGDRWDFALLELSPGTILSHLLLLHNLSGVWLYGIDPPMWSVATEWQIYFFFAFISVPILLRFGGLAAVGFTAAAGIYFSTAVTAFNYACPWFLTLFAFGMGAAFIAIGPRATAFRERIPFQRISRIAIAGYLIVALALPSWLSPICMTVDLIVGGIAALFLVDATLRSDGRLARLAAARPALWLGRCSYSLYLTHVPLLAVGHLTMRRLGMGTTTRLTFMLLIMVPLAVVFAHAFAIVFERPFLRRRSVASSTPVVFPAITHRRAA